MPILAMRHSGTNSRNGSSKKTLKTEKGPIAISLPRDRDGSFEPQIVPKGKRERACSMTKSSPLGCCLSGSFHGLYFVKVRDNQRVVNKAIFVALGINLSGNKELLGLWLAENEGAKFWLSVLTELKN